MNDQEINPYLWFGNRELNFKPKHFITSSVKLTEESKIWVLKNLIGRFAIIMGDDFFMYNVEEIGEISFEDPAECVIYELRWS